MLSSTNAAQYINHLWLKSWSRSKLAQRQQCWSCWDSDLLNHSRVRVLRPVDSSASHSVRTSSLWNEERNQCARKGLLLSVLSDPAERVEILGNMIEAETSNIPFNQWRLHPVSEIPVQFLLVYSSVLPPRPWRNREEERILIMINATGRETKQTKCSRYLSKIVFLFQSLHIEQMSVLLWPQKN